MIGGLIERIVGPASALISEFIEDPDKRAEFEHRLRSQLVQQESDFVNAARDVVVAEAQGESCLQRNWRPLIMLSFGAILVNNYIFIPWMHALGFTDAPLLDIPEGMWGLLTVGLGGYVVGRTIEKTGSSVQIGLGQNQDGKSG